MENTYEKIQELLHQKADYQARRNLIPYDGTPEIKDRDGQKYLYMRKRVGGRLTSTYVDAYSDELYQLLLRNAREARELVRQGTIGDIRMVIAEYPQDWLLDSLETITDSPMQCFHIFLS